MLTVTGLAEDVKEFATGQTLGGLGFSLDSLLPRRMLHFARGGKRFDQNSNFNFVLYFHFKDYQPSEET